MNTYQAHYLGKIETGYSFDGAKAWVSQLAGARLKWVAHPDGNSWYGFKSQREADAFDASAPFGFLARILTQAHRDFSR